MFAFPLPEILIIFYPEPSALEANVVLAISKPLQVVSLRTCWSVELSNDTPLCKCHGDVPLHLGEQDTDQQSYFSRRLFSCVVPGLHNRLPLSLRQLNSTEGLKRQLKTFTFERSYDLESSVVMKDYSVLFMWWRITVFVNVIDFINVWCS